MSLDLPIHVYANFTVATMVPRGSDSLGVIPAGAVVVQGNRIEWVGALSDLPLDYRTAERLEGRGRVLTPGLIDCHTHLVFGGQRIEDWRKRLEGVSYQEIARAGGGILSTVRATREASAEALYEAAADRLKRMLAGGVTTIEIKTGYGLDLENELKQLQVIQRLARQSPANVIPTLLAAHAVPPEYRERPGDYVDLVCNEIIPAAAPHCVAVDAFCESIAFDLAQTERVLRTGLEYGKQIKLHAEQLSRLGGARLAARLGAVSVDHLEYLDEAGVRELAAAGTVAVLLPGAYYFLRETQRPPVDQLRAHGVPLAVATDFNPGSSPLGSLLLAANMAATLFGLTPGEALQGITIEAARALQLDSSLGSLQSGKRADLVCWDCTHPLELIYGIGAYPNAAVIKDGRLVAGQLS
ncbi:MAG: imidazolonepropionase [Planctomycetota bacterium]